MPLNGRKKTGAATLTPDELLARMEHYCAYRERCPKEVRSKLQELGADAKLARQIFDLLQSERFFDEQRFAAGFAGGKFRYNHWGKLRINLELRRRDISAACIREALDAIEEEEYLAVLDKLLDKKLHQNKGDEQARDKTAASLIRAGFEPDLVFSRLQKRK